MEVSELSYIRPNILAGFGDGGAIMHFCLTSSFGGLTGGVGSWDFTKLSDRIFRLVTD